MAFSDRDMLTNDVAILSNYYNDNGYVEHKIDDPVILRGRDGLMSFFASAKARSIASARLRLAVN